MSDSAKNMETGYELSDAHLADCISRNSDRVQWQNDPEGLSNFLTRMRKSPEARKEVIAHGAALVGGPAQAARAKTPAEAGEPC